MRTIVDLPDSQLAGLADICQREGVSRAEVVRRAVAEYLDARQVAHRDESFGIWRDRAVDGLAYERSMRDEWR